MYGTNLFLITQKWLFLTFDTGGEVEERLDLIQ
jgi:hypothetical protein